MPSYSNQQRQRFLTMMLQKMQRDRFDPGYFPQDAIQPQAQGPLSQQQSIQMDPMFIQGNPAGPQPMQMDPITIQGRVPLQQQASRVPSYDEIAARLRAAGM